MLWPPLLLLARAWFPLPPPPNPPPPREAELGRDDALWLPTWFLAVLPAGRVDGRVPALPPPGRVAAPPPPGRVPAPPLPGRFPAPAPPPGRLPAPVPAPGRFPAPAPPPGRFPAPRSEEHTSELQSRGHLVCRLLLEKKNTATRSHSTPSW